MNIKPIKTEADYDSAVERVGHLMNSEPGTPEGDELEVLLVLVGDYDDRHYPIGPPDPVEAIKFVMDQKGLKNKDLVKVLGGANRVSEILSRKRPLTLPMIRKLNKEFGIPAEVLIRESRV